jgi:hypothetical protein
MARTSSESTISPFTFSSGNGVYYEQARDACEMLNYAYQNIGTVHISMVTSDPGWGSSTDEVGTHGRRFSASSGYEQHYRFYIWIDPDCAEVRCRANVAIPVASQTALVRFTVGSTNSVLTYTLTGVHGGLIEFPTSSTGTGWQLVTIELNHSVGSASAINLDDYSVENVQPDSLPAPVLE